MQFSLSGDTGFSRWEVGPGRVQVLLAGSGGSPLRNRWVESWSKAGTAQPHPLFLQVGLVSWGLYDPCQGSSNKNSRKKPPQGVKPRDFHINLFRLQPWLRQHLDGVLNFLPL